MLQGDRKDFLKAWSEHDVVFANQSVRFARLEKCGNGADVAEVAADFARIGAAPVEPAKTRLRIIRNWQRQGVASDGRNAAQIQARARKRFLNGGAAIESCIEI